MVYRIYVEKKEALAQEARTLYADLKGFLGIASLKSVRILNRYDVEDIDEALFEKAVVNVFSEPQVDVTWSESAAKKYDRGTGTLSYFSPGSEQPVQFPEKYDSVPVPLSYFFAVEFLPGQFDQRADSAEQCIRLLSPGATPRVASAKVYILEGDLSQEDIDRIKTYVINPVEAREASLDLPETLKVEYETPADVEILNDLITMDDAALDAFRTERGLAMDLADLKMCAQYFKDEGRAPTITEIKMIDTYWSDHCRHTTFTTTLDDITIENETIKKAYEDYLAIRKELNRTKPVTLMDMGTIAARFLKSTGDLKHLDESEEINACTVKTMVDVNGTGEPWLLLFKNETHNHPTEIEPFGGAATCIGGAIRDPLSGRSYVYGAMRVTGAGNPLKRVEETRKGKLPQKKLVTTAAAGYASYGNQIGLATGIVEEIYHPGYEAKRMEVGAVIAAAPAENVVRETPAAGDLVLLIGGRTGRDGIGGATGSSKSHTVESLTSCGAEVQKGNAPEERKLQRLFRNETVSRMIKRCNDFGAGGVSVAVGELSESLAIDLDKVPKKYEGLDGTELAISESQERMAVVIEEKDLEPFLLACEKENLEATVIARVTDDGRLVMTWRGNTIVDVKRSFLDTNGAEKHMAAHVTNLAQDPLAKEEVTDFAAAMKELVGSLNHSSEKGLSERFDSTIGAGTVLMPFGGAYQMTPIQAMVHKFPVEEGDTKSVSFMSYGFNPVISEKSPYHGAYLAVVESAAKLVATGAKFENVYLSFQEYFERLGSDENRWGKPVAALLGALKAQLGLKVAAIGGKDSMSGSFEDLDVPPTLISFAVTTGKIDEVISPEFKGAGHPVVLVQPEVDADGLPTGESLLQVFETVTTLMREGKVLSAYTPIAGGIAEAVFKMAIGNRVGFEYDPCVRGTGTLTHLFGYQYGSFLLELCDDGVTTTQNLPLEGEVSAKLTEEVSLLGHTTDTCAITCGDVTLPLADLTEVYEATLESVYPMEAGETPHPPFGHLPLKGKVEKQDKELPPRGKLSAELTDEGSKQVTFRTVPFVTDPSDPTTPTHPAPAPRVLIPVFPGTNCEYDSARAVSAAGLSPEILVIANRTPEAIARSVERVAAAIHESQIIFIPGGFSGGDEPDGSAKFITSFFRNEEVKDAVTDLLDNRGGLMLGICNGFQALIKLGLVPYGKIKEPDENAPTLTFNTIGRHQSKIVRVKVKSNASPWLAGTNVNDIFHVPISHGEGRIIAPDDVLKTLAENGQIATQYCDLDGNPTMDIAYNPNGSMMAAEGLLSPDGRVFGKMGHAERIGAGLYQNVPGNYDMKLFRSAKEFFR